MTEDIHCTSMKTLEMNDDTDIVALGDYGNDTRSSVYIPQRRFLRRNKNVLYIAGGSLIIILLVAILLVITLKKSSTYINIEHKTLQSSKSSNNETSSPITSINTTPQSITNTKSTSHDDQPIRLSRALIMTSGRNLWAVDSSNLGHQLLRQMKRNIVVYDVNVNESILWIERNSSVVSCLIDNSSLPYSKKLEPQAMAIDYITDKLYVIDKQAGTLNVIDMQHNQTGIVLSDLEDPHDIALDSSAGLMFIVQLDYSILRCEMDGTSLTEIVKNKPISAIAINRKVKKIYWVTDFNTIKISDYDGVQHLIIHQAHTSNIGSLVFHDDKLFWLSATSRSDKTIVYSCKLTNGIHCDDLLERSVPFSTQNIRAAPESMNAARKNPCATNNGDCEQLCLLNTNGHSCACKIGFQLNRSMKTCDSITKFLLYPDGRYFRGRILGSFKQTFVDVFSPTRFFTLSLEKKDTIDFDRGWNFYEVYFADDLRIYRLNLTDGNQTKVYHISDFKNFHIQSLLVDRRSDNFYFCKTSNHGADRSVVIITIKEGRVLEKIVSSIQTDGPLFFMALHSEYLFYSYIHHERSIRTIAFDGETSGSFEFQVISNSVLSVDHDENILYWIRSNQIWYVPINSYEIANRNFHYLNIQLPTHNVKTLYVYQKWLYIGDETNIWRFDKNTDNDKTLVITSHKRNPDLKISGAQISDLNLLKNENNSACAVDNGGCEQFCFARKATKCSCRDGMTVSEDIHCQ